MALVNGQIQAAMWQQRQDDEAQARLERLKRNWDYYEGRHPLPLVVKPNMPDDNAIVNLYRPCVDKGVAFLFGQGVRWQVDETAAADTTAEQFLDEVWTANNRDVLLMGLALNGANGEIAVAKVTPRPGDTQRPYAIINLDPANVTIDCSDEDIEDTERYRIQYTTCDDRGQELTKRQDTVAVKDANGVTTHWTIQDYTASGAQKQFQPAGPERIWPYALGPIQHCQNLINPNCVQGYADLEDTALQDAINLIVSSTRKILRLHGSPQTVAKGFDPAMLRRDANQIWHIPEADEHTDLFNLEMQSDLASALEFYRNLRAAFYAQGRMPDVSQVGDLGALTNFGLRVLFADALERTATKRLLYGGLIQRINKVLCLIAKKGDNVTTKLTWPDPLPVNKQENVTTVAAEQALGITSDETLAGDLGRDYADEQKRLADERKARAARAPKPVPGVPPGSSQAGQMPPDAGADEQRAMQLMQQAQQGGQQ